VICRFVPLNGGVLQLSESQFADWWDQWQLTLSVTPYAYRFADCAVTPVGSLRALRARFLSGLLSFGVHRVPGERRCWLYRSLRRHCVAGPLGRQRCARLGLVHESLRQAAGRGTQSAGDVGYVSSLMEGVLELPTIHHFVQMIRDAAGRRRAAKLGEKVGGGHSLPGARSVKSLPIAAGAAVGTLGSIAIRWVCSRLMVGAIGFEPMTSTV
jgi:hypothetical protein